MGSNRNKTDKLLASERLAHRAILLIFFSKLKRRSIMYVTDQDIIAYLKSKGYTYLGEEYGMFFYKLPNGKVEGSSDEALVKHIKEENKNE